jgi:AcrR family transcriptional regulator
MGQLLRGWLTPSTLTGEVDAVNPAGEDAVVTTRDALVEAAAALLDEGGVAAVTLREVGRRAGVSHNAPYKHFADKADLLAAVAARELRRQHAGRRVRSGSPAIATIASWLRRQIRHAIAHPELFRLTYGSWRTGSPELVEAAMAGHSAFVAMVTAAQAEGDLPAGDPERVASLLLALTHGACHLTLAGHLARKARGGATANDLVEDLLMRLRPA